ncbi:MULTISPECIES: hypothetical protein [unclassified Halomonas]|uniref:hypothetical protein n=1 Tax=unclassified Halomonas TaxID=2609666 RepID=UPI0028836775|nr:MULTISPECIES: hypothetical protein [unclassified Halomonas]MDT0502207.1 hypothetical protein [Halomonas sp. PAR7]MDT0513377.1 hypothetical protein [Halomonas sp. LES1]MDT0591857.1 hypothetical protein [Halomonas sp. PAR8]
MPDPMPEPLPGPPSGRRLSTPRLLASLPAFEAGWLASVLDGSLLGSAVGGPLSYHAGAELAEVSPAPWLPPAQVVIRADLCLWPCRRLGDPPTPGQ